MHRGTTRRPAPRRTGVALAAAAVLLLAPATAAAAPAAESAAVELGTGHADVGPALVDGSWQIVVEDDAAGAPVDRDPDQVTFRVGDRARSALPEDEDFRFLGAPGDPVHLIPQTQVPGALWLGWNTQHPTLLADPPAAISFRVDDVQGPGALRVYLDYGGFRPPQVLWDSTAPAQDLPVDADVHAHANWAFSAAGDYRARFTATLTAADGTTSTAESTLHFLVGDATVATAAEVADTGGTSPLQVTLLVAAVLAVLAAAAHAIRRR